MAKKVSKFLPPSHRSKTRPGTPPNASKKPAVIGSGRNRPAKNFDPITKTWHQESVANNSVQATASLTYIPKADANAANYRFVKTESA